MAERARKPSTATGADSRRGLAAGLAAAAALALLGAAAHAQPVDEPLPVVPVAEAPEAPLFSVGSPIGPIEYGLGRGLRVGDTGLNVGGFTTLEFDKEEGEHGELELDAFNLLALFEPNQYIRGFAELEVSELFAWETRRDSVDFDAHFSIERLYFDLRVRDPVNLRLGKFQTPIGRWNLVPAEPFVWTAEEPAFAEVLFDEHTTGGTILGSVPAAEGTLDYWIFSGFFDPLYPEDEPEKADHSLGGRIQFGRGVGDTWSIGSSLMGTEINADWSLLGGVDAELRWQRLLLTSELSIQQGRIEDRDLWDFYVQGVFELVPTLYLVARYEHIDFSGPEESSEIGDVGFTWIPKPWLHFKATYRFTDEQTEEVRRGLSASLSFVF